MITVIITQKGGSFSTKKTHKIGRNYHNKYNTERREISVQKTHTKKVKKSPQQTNQKKKK